MPHENAAAAGSGNILAQEPEEHPMREAGHPGGPGKLTLAQQEYVVERLAAFDSPGAIARSLREEFNLKICRTTVAKYDPTRFARCPPRWKELFYAKRQAILTAKGVRSAVDRAVHMRTRERVALRAIETLAGNILNNIARQAGKGFVPARAGKATLTDAERARAILALLQKVEASAAGDQAPQPE